MSVCVPACARGGFESVPYVLARRMGHSRFKGVAGAFQTGTMSTFGREVNWKSMGASVDRSDRGRWAIEVRAGWQTRVERI